MSLDHKRINMSKISLIVSLAMIWLFQGCLLLSPERLDVGNDERWWGDLGKDRIVRLKQDVLLERRYLSPYGTINKDFRMERISVQEFKTDPSRWPQFAIVAGGTRMRCVRLKRYFSTGYGEYEVMAEILDGDHRRKVVDIESLTFGSPYQEGGKGSLKINPEYLDFAN